MQSAPLHHKSFLCFSPDNTDALWGEVRNQGKRKRKKQFLVFSHPLETNGYFSCWFLWKQNWTHILFFYFSDKNANKGEKISFTSWPIGYDKLVTPITLGTWELSKWWDHISVWRLWTQSVLRGCLSISLPICSISQAHMKGREGRAGALWRCLGPD